MGDKMKPTGTTTLDLGSHGQLKGSVFANGVKRFTHVPYALPPNGPRRWKKPEPLPKDHIYGPLDCTQYGNVCPQPQYIVDGSPLIDTNYSFNEDCLAVNVWLPPGDPPKGGWPILAWIHGGWLQIGDPSLKENSQPTQLIAEGGLDAMVVSIGYRLNIFGFLAGKGLEGNFGFWDQRCALEWLQDYAPLLGGDPERITLGGLSAGAFSTHVQLNYELFHGNDKKPLFNNIWLQSNAIPAQPKTLDEVETQFQNVLSTFSISTDLPPSERLDKLRSIPASTLVSRIFDLDIHTFRAVTDGEMIPSDLMANIHFGRFAARFKQRRMRILLGEAETEEVLYSLTNPPPDFSNKEMLKALNNYYAGPVCETLLSLYKNKGSAADERVASALSLEDEQEKAKRLFGLITSDVQVRAPIRVLSKALFDGGVPAERILRYRVAYRPECTDKVYPRNFGVTHAADGMSWWYIERYGFDEEERDNVKRWLGKTLIPLVGGDGDSGKKLRAEELLYFRESGEIGVVEDQQWEWLSHVSETL
ncbi:alpha/beta-hydrolase [Didymella exigua CBS 183.55]|uniref:Alpha/beta-hydrolase n=1 Tax=Didymella exigua CBS 183.55 TaxID=1150837 RepID=A0A6A5RWE7_9PLEO|nr:alpha/beta-hydrolase [Didymella exigua CBS 183.55]KAF1932805.1 alpha/beta-hydrolase [Didymella exigua CBS 183.55]